MLFFLTGVFLLIHTCNAANNISTPTMSTSPAAWKSLTRPTPGLSPPTTSNTSSTQNESIGYLPDVSNKSNSTDYSLALALGCGLGGGLLLAVIAWLVLLTIWACRKIRGTQYTLIDLQKQSAGNQHTVVGNSYHNNMFVNNTTETIERQGDGIPYEIVGRRQTNELFHQTTSGEDQCRVVGGYYGTLYANAGQSNK